MTTFHNTQRRSKLGRSVVLLLGLIGLGGSAAAAPSGPNSALAETLFRQARKLLADGRIPEACQAFGESFHAEAATGTLLNLASCHETEGKQAMAWAEFSDALTRAKREGRLDRARFAEERLAALDKKLPKLAVDASAAETPQLAIAVDGRALGPAAWGIATPIDPGMHEIHAEAPGKKPWVTRVSVREGNEVTRLAVPPLETASSWFRHEEPRRAPSAQEQNLVSSSTRPRSTETPWLSRSTAAVASAGVGAAALVTAGIFALKARGDWATRNRLCANNDDSCPLEAVDAFHDADRAATTADVAFGVGLVAVAAGAYLYFTTPRDTSTPARAAAAPPRARLKIAPLFAPTLAGIGASYRY